MREWLGLVGTAMPALVVLAGLSGRVRGSRLWFVSVSSHLVSLLCFLGLLLSFYFFKTEAPLAQVSSPDASTMLQLRLHWDYWATLLSFFVCVIFTSLHFFSPHFFSRFAAPISALAAYEICFFGAVSSLNLFSFSIFLLAAILPKVILVGTDRWSGRFSLSMETAFLHITSAILLLVCVWIFSGTSSDRDHWFIITGSETEVKSGALGLFLLLTAAVFCSGFFPLHGSSRKVFSLCSMERVIVLSIQSVWGFLLLFRFGPVFFYEEITAYAIILLFFFSAVLLFSAISFLGAARGRERVFWVQQILNNAALVGFWALSYRGWHGALTLISFQLLVVPFSLMLLFYYEEHREAFSFGRGSWSGVLLITSMIGVLSILCLPVSVGFYGFFLVVSSLISVSMLSLGLFLLATLFFVAAGLRILFFRFDADGDEAPARGVVLGSRAIWSLVPIALLLLLLGALPRVLMSPLGQSAMAYMAKVGMN